LWIIVQRVAQILTRRHFFGGHINPLLRVGYYSTGVLE
jgi:hypothetical protein